jgi:hypothetical protein
MAVRSSIRTVRSARQHLATKARAAFGLDGGRERWYLSKIVLDRMCGDDAQSDSLIGNIRYGSRPSFCFFGGRANTCGSDGSAGIDSIYRLAWRSIASYR